MVIVTAEFDAAAGHQAALEGALTSLAEGYQRVGTQVQLFRPLTGAMASYLAIFQFDSLAAYAAWRQALAEDTGFSQAMAAFRDHVGHWQVTLHEQVKAVDS